MTETADRMRAYVRKNAKFGPLTDSDVEQVAELLAEYAASERAAGFQEGINTAAKIAGDHWFQRGGEGDSRASSTYKATDGPTFDRGPGC